MSRFRHHLGMGVVGLAALLAAAYASVRFVGGPGMAGGSHPTPQLADDLEALGAWQPGELEQPAPLSIRGGPPAADRIAQGESFDTLTLDVLVQDATTGRPIPGCELRYYEELPLEATLSPRSKSVLTLVRGPRGKLALFALDCFPQDPAATFAQDVVDLEVLRTRGKLVRSDEQGRCRLICRRGIVGVLVATETHWGFGTRDLNDIAEGELTIACAPATHIQVQVTDEAGRGLAGVGLRLEHGGTWPDVGALFTTTSAPDGLARLGPISTLGPKVWYVRLRGVFPSQQVVEVRLEQLPPDPAVIVMPAHGSLEVRLVDPSGRRVACPGIAKIGARLLPAGTWVEAVDPSTGIASFERVGSLHGYWVGVSIPGIERSFGALVSGPPAGGAATAAVEIPFHPTWLTLRLRDSTQGVFPRTAMQYALVLQQAGTRTEFTGTEFTDDQGRLAFALDDPEFRGAQGTIFVRAQGTMFDRGQAFAHRLGYFAPVVVARGPNSLSEALLVEAELLASGTVIDANGEACPGAVVQLAWDETAGTAPLDWAEEAICDQAGRFELRGWSAQPRTGLRASLEARTSATVSVATGAQGVVLQLPASDG